MSSRYAYKIILLLQVNMKYAATAASKSLQSRPTLGEPTDGSPRGSPVSGILQARKYEV